MYYQPEPTLLTIASGEQGVVEEQVEIYFYAVLLIFAKPKYSCIYKIIQSLNDRATCVFRSVVDLVQWSLHLPGSLTQWPPSVWDVVRSILFIAFFSQCVKSDHDK